MLLNNEQKAAVALESNGCVTACPGSGKTRTIVAKLLKCIDEVRDSSRRIACITYTHAAVDEIEQRLRQYGSTVDEDYAEVGTIHSFCLANVLRPFYYMLPELAAGFDILAPESEEWQTLISDLAERYGVDGRRLDSFTNVHRRPDRSMFVPPEIPDAAAAALIDHLDSSALVSFPDIVYHSCRLIQRAPFIARGLASRFAWILVDEFQDTAEGQVVVLRAIARHRRTRFLLVADPHQSIMGFAGAHPSLMEGLSREIGARTDLELGGNYRCSERIVAHAERLIRRVPRMQAVGEWRHFPVEPAWIHVPNPITGVCERFLPALQDQGIPLGRAAVLAPWWLTLYHLGRQLNQRGVPALGPGARPYRRSRLFATFAESLCAYTEDGTPDSFRTAQKALFVMLLNITSNPEWRVFSYDGRRCVCNLAEVARALREDSHDVATAWLRTAAREVARVLVEYEFLGHTSAHIVEESVEDMIRDIERNDLDATGLRVSDLALYARPRDCLHLLTMHGSKGREFDAVAIIDLHEGRVPHFTWRSQEEYDEARRQLYVAITRARKVLMYFTDSSHPRNRPSPFLSEMGLVESA